MSETNELEGIVMPRLFISYSYIARSGKDYYEGFGNMVCGRLTFAPLEEEHIELIEHEANEHCIKKLGAESAICTLINWKTMDGA